jgi:DNA-binding NarL/FixJ family response regulator
MAVSIILFEDNVVLRKALVGLLNNSGKYFVCGDYDDVNKVPDVIQAMQPEVVILDINMPGMNGIEAISVIKEAKPDISIIMYTQFEDDEKLFNSLCAGADGYILKNTSPFKLIEAIDDVYAGGTPLSPVVAKKILNSFRSKNKPLGTNYHLTSRESEILHLLVKGYSVKLIAAEVEISYDTCRTHLRNIYRKLHVNCGKEAIAKILAEKIIS